MYVSETHSVHGVEKWKIYSHWKKISSNQLFSNFFSKTVTFTKFLPKMHESKFPEFPHCALQWICNRFHGKNREIETRTICVLELWMWLHEKKDEMKWAKLLDSFCVWFNVKIDIDFSFLNIWFHGKSYEIEKHVMPLNVISRKKIYIQIEMLGSLLHAFDLT